MKDLKGGGIGSHKSELEHFVYHVSLIRIIEPHTSESFVGSSFYKYKL